MMRRLQKQLQFSLPGQEYQLRMAHLNRIGEIPMRPDVRHAAVLVLLFEKGQELHVVLIKRRAIEADVHSGQISFPGGRVQKDETTEEAALRESYEEIGSPAHLITTLGRLTQLHIPVSNHLVFPVVGYLQEYGNWNPQEEEVDFILEVPIPSLQLPETRIKAPVRIKEGLIIQDVPCFRIENHLIWGATAMILSEFLEVMSAAGK